MLADGGNLEGLGDAVTGSIVGRAREPKAGKVSPWAASGRAAALSIFALIAISLFVSLLVTIGALE